MAKKKIKEEKTSTKEVTGCRLCKYRVSIPEKKEDPTSKRIPSCCFGEKVNDKVRPKDCDFFEESDYYIKHPEEL